MRAGFSRASPTDVSARRALSASSYLLSPYVHWEGFGRHLHVEVIVRGRSYSDSTVWDVFLPTTYSPCLKEYCWPDTRFDMCSTSGSGCCAFVWLCSDVPSTLLKVGSQVRWNIRIGTGYFYFLQIFDTHNAKVIFHLFRCKVCTQIKWHSSYYTWKLNLKESCWFQYLLNAGLSSHSQRFQQLVPWLPEGQSLSIDAHPVPRCPWQEAGCLSRLQPEHTAAHSRCLIGELNLRDETVAEAS